MCIPLKYLKPIVGSTTTITILLGVFAIISAGIIQSNTKQVNFFDSTGHQIKDTLVFSLYICGAGLGVLGILGLIGNQCKNVCLLTSFNIGQIIGVVLFLTISTFGFIISNEFSETTLEQCEEAKWSNQLNQLTQTAQINFCRVGCPCNIESTTTWPTNYFQIFGIIEINANGATQFQGCSQYFGDNDSNSQLIDQAELKFECAGWCYPSGVYLFSDVNRGPPSTIGGCFVQVSLWMQYYGIVLGAVSLSISILLVISLILTMCLCCHPVTSEKIDNEPDFRNKLLNRLSAYYNSNEN